MALACSKPHHCINPTSDVSHFLLPGSLSHQAKFTTAAHGSMSLKRREPLGPPHWNYLFKWRCSTFRSSHKKPSKVLELTVGMSSQLVVCSNKKVNHQRSVVRKRCLWRLGEEKYPKKVMDFLTNVDKSKKFRQPHQPARHLSF